MRRLSRYALRTLIVTELLLAFSILRDVANVTTTRLYLSARVEADTASDAVERFDVETSRVVPQISIRHDERIAFRTDNQWPSTLHVEVRPAGSSRYEIHWRDGATDRVLANGAPTAAATTAVDIPAGNGVVELVG